MVKAKAGGVLKRNLILSEAVREGHRARMSRQCSFTIVGMRHRLIGPLGILLCVWVMVSSAGAQTKPQEATHKTEAAIPYRSSEGLSAEAAASVAKYCLLDLHRSVNSAGFPTVVWLHGGGLTGGGREIPELLKRRGFAVVSAGYRLSPQSKSPAYIEDAAAAIAWTVKNIGRYGGDPNRIIVTGHSAGGYLALMCALDKRYLQAHGVDADSIAGWAPLSPQTITHFTIRRERGIEPLQPVVDELAPLFHVRRDTPPILLVTGDREKELYGRYEETAYFWRMLKLHGHERVDLIELKDLDHGQMVDPGIGLTMDFVRRRVAELDAGGK